MTITFYQDSTDLWRWRVVASNNEIVGASSESFTSEAGARRNLDRLAIAIADRAGRPDTFEGGN